MANPQGDTTKVLLNDFSRQWADTHADVMAAVQRVGQSGWYILGTEVAGFERALAATLGVAHAVGCASGLDAIEIGLRALGLRPGDRVLTTPTSAFATTLGIVRAGGVPVFVDTDADGFVDLDLCDRAFADDTAMRFFVPVHLYGQPLNLDRLAALRDKFHLRVVEDCAQAIGASWGHTVAGTVGQVGVTSFYPTKNLGALGDGGALFMADDGLRAASATLRHYGQSTRYVHDRMGLNSRLDELHAAILGTVFLPKLNQWTTRRRAVMARYRAGLHNPLVRLAAAPTPAHGVGHLFPVFVAAANRSALSHALETAGIQTAVHYPRIIPDQQALSDGAPHHVLGNLPNARRLAQEELSLPIHPFVTDAEVDRVIAAVNAWRTT